MSKKRGYKHMDEKERIELFRPHLERIFFDLQLKPFEDKGGKEQ